VVPPDEVAYCESCSRYSLHVDWDYEDAGQAGPAEECPCCGVWRLIAGIFEGPWNLVRPNSLGPFESESERLDAARQRLQIPLQD
jgi:hypothetical protein